MKKIFLNLILCLIAFQVFGVVTREVTVDGIKYEVIYNYAATGNKRTAVVLSVPSYFSGNLTLPGSVKDSNNNSYTLFAIGEHAIEDNTKLESITLPYDFNWISGDNFSGCESLEQFIFNYSEKNLSADDGVLYTKQFSRYDGESKYYQYNGLLRCPPAHRESYTIKHYAVGLCDWSFAHCSIDTLEIPETVQYCRINTFYDFKGCLVLTNEMLCTDGQTNCDSFDFLSAINSNSTVLVHPRLFAEAKGKFGLVKPLFPIWVEAVSDLVEQTEINFKVNSVEGYDRNNIQKVVVDGKEVFPDNDGLYTVTDLIPNTSYTIYITYKDFDGTIRTSDEDKVSTKDADGIGIVGCKPKQGQLNFTISASEYFDPEKYEYGIYYQWDSIDYYIPAQYSGTLTAKVDNLFPDCAYLCYPYIKFGDRYYIGAGEDFHTNKLAGSIEYKSYQTAFTVKSVDLNSDGTFNPDGYEIKMFEWEDDDREWTPITKLPVTYKNLGPGYMYWTEVRAVMNGSTYLLFSQNIPTEGLDASIIARELSPSVIEAECTFVEGKDYGVKVSKIEWTSPRKSQGNRLILADLIPNTTYELAVRLTPIDKSNPEANFFDNIIKVSFKTPDLKLTTLTPKIPTEKNAIAAASTNLSDRESNAGFQWRKYDAPSTLASNEGYAAIYDGMMEGYIHNLQLDKYYNVRAFFKDANGTYHYSDWVTFDPSDVSWFEPTVHTYEPESVTHNSVSIRGYITQGSEDIESQGFEYWPMENQTQVKTAFVDYQLSSTNEKKIILSTGQAISATISDLMPATEYIIRSFAKTADHIYYGEELTFHTLEMSGVENVSEDQPQAVIGYFNIMGVMSATPFKGINVVLYNDGHTEKRVF